MQEMVSVIEAIGRMDSEDRELLSYAVDCLRCRAYADCAYGQQVARQPQMLQELVPGSAAQGLPMR